MFDKINATLDFQKQALALRNERQQVLANNIANADTPNFKARDFDFGAELRAAMSRTGMTAGSSSGLEKTSPAHIGAGSGSELAGTDLMYRVPAQPSLDGNTVDMDRERTEFLDNSVRYQASLVMINSYLQGLKSAIQPE